MLGHGRKLLLVIDQFEQWLHARRGDEEPELTAALRQCDGEHFQAIVLVRDDFGLAVGRFLADLEIGLIQGHNTALVDLFDKRHALKVLTAFGSGLGDLPGKHPGNHPGAAAVPRPGDRRAGGKWESRLRAAWLFSPKW